MYRSLNIVRVIKSTRNISRVCRQNGIKRSAFQILTEKLTEKRPLGKRRRKWEDTTRIDCKEIGISTGIGKIRLRRRLIGEPLWMLN